MAGPGSRVSVFRVVFAATAILTLGGCIPRDARPDLAIDVTPHYGAAAGGPAKPVRADWPRLFRSAELSRLVERAEGDNFDIAAALARISQAQAQARIAEAALYPTLDGSANASRSLSAGALRSKRKPFESNVGNQFNLGLSASYEIDFWGKNSSAAEAGRLAAEATRFDRDVVALTTVGNVVSAYFQVLGAQDRLAIARENIAAAERTLKVIQARLSVGTATQLDIAQQESVVAQQKAAIPPLELQLRQSKVTLALLVGGTPAAVAVKGGSLNRIAIPAVRPGLPAELLQRRPDIAEAEASLASGEASLASARAALFPNVTLTGQGGLESAVLKNLLRPEAGFASAAAGLTQPLLDGGALKAEVDVQKANRDELLATYRKSIISAFSDVENALIGIQENSSHERLQAETVSAARRAFDITEQRLREGTIDITTLLTTEQTLFQAQDQLSQIRLQRLQSYIDLFKALGGGFTPASLLTVPAPAAGGESQ